MSWIAAGLAVGGFAADIWSASEADKAKTKSTKKTKKQLAELFESTKKQLGLQRDIDIEQLERTGESLVGQQKTAYAAGGVKINIGTPLAVKLDTESQIEMDKETIQTKYDLDVNAALKTSEAGIPTSVPSTLGSTFLESGLTLLTSGSVNNYWGLFE